MKKHYLFLCLLILSTCTLFAQTLEVHSISAVREPTGDSGYTLNGIHMLQTSTAKLLNTDLFGNIYPKTINITNAYESSGSLELISFSPGIDLFIFGTFNKGNLDFIPFTDAELDSLYVWSKRGGKMIVGGSAGNKSANFDPSNPNEKWGFEIEAVDPFLSFIQTTEGTNSTIFNGPFGIIENIDPPFQGGFAQGYFSAFPEGAIVLAEDDLGHPTLVLDCNTLDLIISDFDGFTELGGISLGDEIINANDIFWTNAIVYMDELQDPPSISIDGDQLSTGTYESYQWFLNGEMIDGATESTYTAAENGAYVVQVSMDCGCNYTSDEIMFTVSNISELIQVNQVNVFPNPVSDQLNLEFTLLDKSHVQVNLYDNLGKIIPHFQQTLNLPAGEHRITENIADLASGFYHITLLTEKGILAVQFMK